MKRLRCIHNVTTNEILSGIHMVEVGSNLSESDDYMLIFNDEENNDMYHTNSIAMSYRPSPDPMLGDDKNSLMCKMDETDDLAPQQYLCKKIHSQKYE